MPHVVVERIAGKIAGEAAFEQRRDVGEAARERSKVGAGVAGREQAQHRIANAERILDVHAVADVVLVQPILHAIDAQASSRAASPPSENYPLVRKPKAMGDGR